MAMHHQGQLVLTDTGRSIELADCDRSVDWLPWALDLARRRFGPGLAVQSGPQLCHEVIQCADAIGCTVSLGLPAWPAPAPSGNDVSPDESDADVGADADAETGWPSPTMR